MTEFDIIAQHDDRLSKVEDQIRANSVQLAANNARLEAIGDKFDAHVDDFCARMDALTERMVVGFDSLAEKLTDHAGRLQSLEETRVSQRSISKWAAGIAATMIGAVVLFLIGLK